MVQEHDQEILGKQHPAKCHITIERSFKMLLHAAHITIYANKNTKYTPSAQAFINSFCSSVFKKKTN